MYFTKPLARLIEEFQKFPSVGPKSAQRMAFHVLDMSGDDVARLAESILEAKSKVRRCRNCFNLSAQETCEICLNEKRDKQTICVVAEARDLMAIERTQEYKGSYHVLNGLISPLEGRGPDEITARELVNRIAGDQIGEVILAISPTVEGDATALYLTHLIKPSGVKISRIAFGLPAGGDLEYADDLTLARALEGRREL